MEHVKSEDNVSDILTKNTSTEIFNKLSGRILNGKIFRKYYFDPHFTMFFTNADEQVRRKGKSRVPISLGIPFYFSLSQFQLW